MSPMPQWTSVSPVKRCGYDSGGGTFFRMFGLDVVFFSDGIKVGSKLGPPKKTSNQWSLRFCSGPSLDFGACEYLTCWRHVGLGLRGLLGGISLLLGPSNILLLSQGMKHRAGLADGLGESFLTFDHLQLIEFQKKR